MKDDFRECCRLHRRGFLGCEVARAAEPTRVAIAVTLSMGSLSKRSCVRSHRHRVRAFIPPRVPGTILDDDIALFEMNGFSVIQFKPYCFRTLIKQMIERNHFGGQRLLEITLEHMAHGLRRRIETTDDAAASMAMPKQVSNNVKFGHGTFMSGIR